jgi:hypothetical protein
MITVFESSTTLYPRLDQNHYDTAFEVLHETMEKHPEYKNYQWEWSMDMYSDNTADLRITVKDDLAVSGQVVWFFILAIIALAWFYFGG